MSAPAFSPLVIRIDGQTLDNTKLHRARLIRYTEKTPAVTGYIRSELVIVYHGELEAGPDSAVEISFGTARYAVHYIDSIKRKGGKVTVRAGDLMRNTGRLYTGEIPEQIHTPSFISAVARECGFTGAENVPLMQLMRADVKDRTVKQILTLISDYACGVWYCTNSGALRFTAFTESSGSISPYEHAPVYIHSVTGPFAGVSAENTSSRRIYNAGQTGDERTTVFVSGSTLTSERARELASSVAGKSIRSFYCAYVKFDEATEGITAYYIDGVTYTAYRTVTELGTDMHAEICTEDIFPKRPVRLWDNETQLTEGRLYNSALVDTDGLCITEKSDEEDIRLRRKYTFSAAEEGVTVFEGAVMDGVMPTETEHLSATRERIVYGDTAYILSYDIQGGKKTNIRLEREVR